MKGIILAFLMLVPIWACQKGEEPLPESTKQKAEQLKKQKKEESEKVKYNKTLKWDKEPDSYRSIPWRASEKTVRKAIKNLQCTTIPPLTTRYCSANLKLGDRYTQENFEFENDELKSVTISYTSTSSGYFKEIFLEKYGPPIICKRNLGCAFQEKDSDLWMGENVTILMGEQLANFHVNMTPEEEAAYKAQTQAAKKKALDDL